MSNMLPYNFDSHSIHTSPSVSRSRGFTNGSHALSSPAALVFRQPESASPSLRSSPSSSCLFTPSLPSHHSLTVAEWAGIKRGSNTCSSSVPRAPAPESGDWKDVHSNIKRMDHLYDATFYSWLKSEDNVLVTAMYLHRIANEYDLERMANALKWLVQDWRWESTSILVRHVTVDWCDEEGDHNRAYLLRHLTQNWATQYTATLITTILATPPYVSSDNTQRECFLRAFARDWDFSKLSEFFMYLQSRANVDYKLKCIMLQEAAQRERETLSAKLNTRIKRAELKNRQEISSSTSSSSNSINISNATHSHHYNSHNHMELDPPQLPTATTDSHHDEPMVTEHSHPEQMLDAVDLVSTFSPTTMDSMTPHTEESVTDETAFGSSSPSAPPSGTTWRHHRRTSSNDATDMNKRFRISRTAIETEESENAASSSSSSVGCLSATTSMSLDPPSQSSSNLTSTTNSYAASTTSITSNTSTATATNVTMSRCAATPDHSYFHRNILCPSSPNAAPTQTTTPPSAAGSSSMTSGTNAAASNNSAVSTAITPENYLHHHYHHHHQAGDTGGIGSDLSHLHLGFAGGGGSSSAATASTSSSPANTFTSSRHNACYQTPPPSSSAPSSHLQVHHTFHLRRRSSSSSSTTSSGSVGSSHPTGGSGGSSTTTVDHLEDDSSAKKRSVTSANNQETATPSSVYR